MRRFHTIGSTMHGGGGVEAVAPTVTITKRGVTLEETENCIIDNNAK